MKIILTTLVVILLFGCTSGKKQKHTSAFTATPVPELSDFFKYKAGAPVIISAHRGGRAINLPENSIESFKYITDRMPVIFEIDPRLTKDSVIVLLHDKTLDRTTTGKGKLNNYTYAELKDIRLKDQFGNITSFNIPTLKEAIKWSKGKTVLNLDKKDVPLSMTVALIKEMHATGSVMVTVHTGAQSRYYYDRLPNLMQSAFARNSKEYEDLTLSGVPWHNIIAYIGPAIDDSNSEIVKKLRDNGVRCMVSYAPTYDKIEEKDDRDKAYREGVLTHPDIIETDLPLEVWNVIKADSN